MRRYINADILMADLIHRNCLPATVKRAINEAPTADVVEVVRCKDCQYWTGKDYDGCCIKNGLATRYANDYCSYGERSENGT